MSEFPEWVEERLGLGTMSYEESKKLHHKIAIVNELIPDIDERMRSNPLPRRRSKVGLFLLAMLIWGLMLIIAFRGWKP